MSELSHLNVIVLRSARDQDPLAELVSARGGRTHQLPVQKITAMADDDTSIASKIERIESYQKAVFVSRNAALLALRWLDHGSLRLSSQLQCFAVGPTSAAVLENRQIPVEFPAEDWNSEGLLALPAMNDIAGQDIIIFRGRGGRPILGEEMIRRGARVEYCELYQRQQDNQFEQQIIELLTNVRPCALLAHSGGIIDALVATTGAQHRSVVKACPLIVPGLRLQKYAQELGFQQVIVATSALAKDIEQALLGWYTSTLKDNR